MKFTEPVLFPVNVSLLKVFKIIGENLIKKPDILGNYNYKEVHHDLISKYIDPNLLKSCYKDLIRSTYELDDVVSRAEASVYKDYYLYFLCCYIQETGPFKSALQFGGWLKEQHDFTFKMQTKTRYINSIKANYNTIIVPELWRHIERGNMFNRLHKLNANYFDQFETLKKAVRHLTEGGKVYLFNKRDYSWVINCLGDNFDEVGPFVFQKRITPKPKTKTTIKLWL